MRDEVKWFVEQMEQQLEVNNHKRGWQDLHLLWLSAKLQEEVGEVAGELLPLFFSNSAEASHTPSKGWTADIIRECADVANIAMMIADRLRGRS